MNFITSLFFFESFIVQSLIKIEKIFLNYEISSITVVLNGVVIYDSNGMEAPLDGYGPNLVPFSLLLVIFQHVLVVSIVVPDAAFPVLAPCIV